MLTDTRGFDHGTFVPLKLAFPDAAIPVVQLSLLASMDAKVSLPLIIFLHLQVSFCCIPQPPRCCTYTSQQCMIWRTAPADSSFCGGIGNFDTVCTGLLA